MSGKRLFDFASFQDSHSYGANLGAVDIDGDGTDELLVGEGVGPRRPSTVRIHRLGGQLIHSWEAYPDLQ